MFDMEDGVTVAYALDRYDEMLDETLSVSLPEMGGFDASRVLKALDPIAYRCGFHDWLDSEGIDSDTLTGSWGVLP